jgi:hypothetical protein
LHALKENYAPNYKYLENKKLAIHQMMRKYRLVEMVGKFPLGLGIFPYRPPPGQSKVWHLLQSDLW